MNDKIIEDLKSDFFKNGGTEEQWDRWRVDVENLLENAKREKNESKTNH